MNPHFFGVHLFSADFFNEFSRRCIIEALIHLVNRMCEGKKQPWDYLKVVPLIHLLRGESVPFELHYDLPISSKSTTVPNRVVGLDYLQHDIITFEQ